MSNSRREQRYGTALVAAQFTLIGVALLPIGPTIGSGWPWLAASCLAGAGVIAFAALWALGGHTRIHPVPHEGAVLRTAGIYGWIRHPMYTAVLLAVAGIAAASGRITSWFALVGIVVVLWLKARFEDRLLRQRFGPAFEQYRTRVPAFLPTLRSIGGR